MPGVGGDQRANLNQQLAQEDDDFEIRSLADSLDIEEEGSGRDGPSEQIPVPNGNATRGLSPMPSKPAPTARSPQPRESLDGETIFAVGEDGDRWSDDEPEDDLRRTSGEGKKLE